MEVRAKRLAAVDPVCGKTLDTRNGIFSETYAAKTYHFCSDECRRRFSELPAAYTMFSPPPQERMRVTLPILGADTDGALAVERALRQVPGVVRAYANPATEMTYVEYDPQLVNLERVKKAIESAGHVRLQTDEDAV